LTTDARPNILIIHADQHRADCLGCYGDPNVQTPHIDALAADGVLFRNTFCPYPVCTPSRYSLLTGLYARQHLGWSNHSTIPSGLPTLPRACQQAGYHTKAVGKMHFTPTYLDLGFDDMLLAEQHGPGRYDDDYHRWLMVEGLCDRVDLMDQVRDYRKDAPDVYWESVGAMVSDLDEKHHSTTWIGERALEEVQTWESGGNLLMVGFIKPHHPFDPPRRWADMYDPEELKLLPGWRDTCLPEDVAYNPGYFPHAELTEQKLRLAMARYYATISQIDDHVGKIIGAVKAAGLYEDTIIVYTSDHGDYMGFHHLLLKGNHMYDPLVRVPMIIKYPANRDAGAEVDALVSVVDTAPTLLSTAGLAVPATMKGLVLDAGTPGRDVVYTEDRHGQVYMARSRTHKLLLHQDSRHSQFFDLQHDPLEMENLFRNPAAAPQLNGLRERLHQWALHESVSPSGLDEEAPIITEDHARTRADGHRPSAAEHFRRKMAEPHDFG
jgi:arylsulfatase